MPEIKCEFCGKVFNNEQGLSNHKRDKHGIKVKKYSEEKNFFNRKLIFYFVVFLLIVSVVIAVRYFDDIRVDSCQTKDVKELFITDHTETLLHIHSDLKIIINGKQEIIPVNIGIEGNIMRAVHTHDASGKIHIEPPCVRDLTLGDFFIIWNKEFNSQCIFDSCISDSTNVTLNMFVNGKESDEFENLILKDDQEIVIEYNSKL